MSFASLPFLFFFLPLFFAVYYSALFLGANLTILNGLALGSSLLFFAWGAPRFLPFLLFCCLLDYALSRKLHTSQNPKTRLLLLRISILLNVGSLAYFKYANFFVGEINGLLLRLGASTFSWTTVLLPIGISFITFEKLSYIIDVYRRRCEPAPNLSTYLLFIALFPHLIAGPIFRYHDLAEQFTSRKHTLDKVTDGVLRFIIGLSKKVLIADSLGLISDKIFGLPNEELTFTRSWLGILAYSFQIYFDFSGYSDMAIGLGRMMGFTFQENFSFPYISRSISEFWKRWHISLSSWLREYLYYPLGGNRGSELRTYCNLWIVFLISGFWHGANWTFLLWGAFHGLFLTLDKCFLLNLLRRLPEFLQTAFTFIIVLLGWVLFRAESLEQALHFYGHMFQPFKEVSVPPNLDLLYQYNPRLILAFGMAFLCSFWPLISRRTVQKLSNSEADRTHSAHVWPMVIHLRFAFQGGVALLLLLLSAAALTASAFHPFIYFRF